jgi:hypothetical protein
MNRGEKLMALIIMGVGVTFLLSQYVREPIVVTAPPDTVYTRVMDVSRVVAETTRSVITRYDTLFQQRPGDTIYLTRTQWDTVRITCLKCATQLDSLRHYTDSARKKDADSIAKLNRKLVECKGSRPWWALGGHPGGVASCRLPG